VAYLVYALLVYLGLHYTLALLIDYIVGIFLGLFLHHKITFKIENKINKRMTAKAIISNILIFIINIIALYIMVDLYGFNEYFSQIVTLIIIVMSSFIAYRFFVFNT
jgi:putative flippase GtrA